MKTLLLIGTGLDSPDTVQRIHDCGIKVVLAQHPSRFDNHQSQYAECVILTDFQASDFFHLAERLHQHWQFTAALSLTEAGVEVAARLNAHWGIPWTPVNVIQLLKNKAAMRQKLNQQKFSPVPCRLCHSEQELYDFVDRENLPVILKPVDGGGSEDIYKISASEQIAPIMEKLQKRKVKVLVEAWIDGQEYSVESFSFSGEHRIIAITEKQVNTQFVEIGHIIPARLDTMAQTAITEFVTTFLSLIGVTDGPCHTELKISKSGIKIIESHNRIGGGNIGFLVRHVYGIDMITLAAKWACGRPIPELTELKPQGCATVRFFLFAPGILQAIQGEDTFKDEAGDRLLAFKLHVHPGKEIPNQSSNSARAGYFILCGTEGDETWHRAEHLAQYIHGIPQRQ
jgi:biotin carboxylase